MQYKYQKQYRNIFQVTEHMRIRGSTKVVNIILKNTVDEWNSAFRKDHCFLFLFQKHETVNFDILSSTSAESNHTIVSVLININ